MFSSLLERLKASGIKNPRRSLALAVMGPIVCAGVVQEWLGVAGLTAAVAAGGFALEYELLSVKAQIRQRKILEAWPIVIESLESAAIAGMSLLESLRDLAESEQLQVSGEFAECCTSIDSGLSFDQALIELKSNLGNSAADFTIELMRTANDVGATGYVPALRAQAQTLRQNSATASEIAAKQGWVVGTAKLAVTAPWLIVAILSVRPENAQLYGSITGSTILILGLVASSFALRMVYRIGNVARRGRVFA